VHSAIYQGYLRHRRFRPNAHRFSYQVFMMYLDLDELDEVFALSPLWSARSWRPARFQRSDFLGDPQVALKQAVLDRIHEATGARHEGPVRMLANLRYFGFNINPICCYYCFDDSEDLRYIVVEVTNTPWNERQSYVLQCDPGRRFQRINFHKQMHVSPFNPKGDQVHVDATMALKRREISASSLTGILLQHPWMTAKVAAAIYWQALKLWIKRNPFYDHPATDEQGGLDQPTITRLKTKT
jgi:DUF1365 family protein